MLWGVKEIIPVKFLALRIYSTTVNHPSVLAIFSSSGFNPKCLEHLNIIGN